MAGEIKGLQFGQQSEQVSAMVIESRSVQLKAKRERLYKTLWQFKSYSISWTWPKNFNWCNDEFLEAAYIIVDWDAYIVTFVNVM